MTEMNEILFDRILIVFGFTLGAIFGYALHVVKISIGNKFQSQITSLRLRVLQSIQIRNK